MKQGIKLAVFLFIFSTYTNAQLTTINENPVAFQYLLKHFGLKGKVKSITTFGLNNSLISEEFFDPNGRIISSISNSWNKTWSYDQVKNIIKVTTQYSFGSAVEKLYQYNRYSEVEQELYKEGDPLRQYRYRDTLLIMDTTARRYAFPEQYYRVYSYNNKGQLIKGSNFNDNLKLSKESTYTYDNNVVTIKEIVYPSLKGDTIRIYESKKYYDTNGNLLKSTFTANGKTETTEYQLDEFGNWIWKTGGTTRKIQYYDTRMPKNNIQSSLILDENFDNNNSKWNVWENESSAAQIANGNYKVINKVSNNLATWLSVPALSYDQTKDFSIETKIFLKTTETGNPNDSYWLLWGIGNNARDFYAFGIYPEGKFQYGKLVNNVWDAKAGYKPSAAINAGINKANVLRVEKRGDTINFFINGIQVYRASYEKFDKNFAGVGYQFNNKKILDIDYLRINR